MKKLLWIAGSILAALALWWLLAWRDDVNLKKADDLKAQAEESRKAAQEATAEVRRVVEESKREREANEADRQRRDEQVQALVRSMAARDAAADRRVAAVLATKTPEQVSQNAKDVLGIQAPIIDGKALVTLSELNDAIATRIDRDRLAENKKELEETLQKERENVASLKSDLAKAIEAINKQNEVDRQKDNTIALQSKTIEAYEKVAKKSRLRKTLEFSGRTGIALAFGYLGAKWGAR